MYIPQLSVRRLQALCYGFAHTVTFVFILGFLVANVVLIPFSLFVIDGSLF